MAKDKQLDTCCDAYSFLAFCVKYLATKCERVTCLETRENISRHLWKQHNILNKHVMQIFIVPEESLKYKVLEHYGIKQKKKCILKEWHKPIVLKCF